MTQKTITITFLLIALMVISSAEAGPNHESAINDVKAAEAIRDQGQLDAAMAALQAVADKYPEELEAIGWAKFRKAEILDAGGRIDEAAREIKWPWEKCDDGTIANPDLKFWTGCLYAKSLYTLGVSGDVVVYVCRKSLDVYGQLGQSNPAMRENAGWLQYWKAAANFNEGRGAEALADAGLAFQTGNDLHNGSMAARARLLLGQLDMEEGNLISARNIFEQCLEDYAPTMPPAYSGEAHVSLIRCECRFGLISQALKHAVSLFESNTVGQDLQANALVAVAEEALARSATDTAVQALVLQRQAIPEVGAWSEIGDHLWTLLSESYGEGFPAKLDEISQASTGNIGSAVDLAIASVFLSSATEKASAVPYLSSAEVDARDQRLVARLGTLRGIAADAPEAPETDAEIINSIKGDWLALEKYLREARERPGYVEWLDSHQKELPAGKYYLEKGNRLLHKEVLPRQPGDPEYQTAADGRHQFYYEPHRNADAVPVFREAVKLCANTEDRVMAYVGLVSALARTDQDYSEVLSKYLAETVDPRRRGQGIIQMAENLSGYNVVSCSLPNQRPAVARYLFDLAIAQVTDPEWNREAYYLKGKLQNWQQKPDEAIATLRQITELPPLQGDVQGRIEGEANVLLGQIYVDKGQLQEAEACFRRVVENPESYAKGRYGEACLTGASTQLYF